MNRKPQVIFRWIFILLSVLVSALMGMAVLTAEKPPVAAIHKLQKTISEAKQAGAKSYASEILGEAELKWVLAIGEWQHQNEKWFLSRNFSKMQSLITEGAQQAQQAKIQAISFKGSLKNTFKEELSKARQAIMFFKTNYSHLPLDKTIRTDFARSQLLIQESELAYSRHHYHKANEKIKDGESLLTKSITDTKKFLDTYLQDLPTWQNWAQTAIAWSKENSKTAIIVNKLAHTCLIYKNGKLLNEFDIEMGSNWIGDKRYKGDKATPEGHYFIVKKKTQGETKYHKALLINYPNPEDRSRFKTEVKNGDLPKSTRIGGMVEIHGGGGKGINWTDGCVALENDDLDKLYELVIIGTPVIVVGSLSNSNRVF